MYLYSANGLFQKIVTYMSPPVEHFVISSSVGSQSYFIYMLNKALLRKYTIAQFQADMKRAEDVAKDIEFRGGFLLQTQKAAVDATNTVSDTANQVKVDVQKQVDEFNKQASQEQNLDHDIQRRIDDLRKWRIEVDRQDTSLQQWEEYVQRRKANLLGMGASKEDLAVVERYILDTREAIKKARAYVIEVDQNIKTDMDVLYQAKQGNDDARANLAKTKADTRQGLQEALQSVQKLVDTTRKQIYEVIQPYDAQVDVARRYVEHCNEIEKKVTPPTDPQERSEWLKALNQTTTTGSTLSSGGSGLGGGGVVSYTYPPDYNTFINHINYNTYKAAALNTLKRLDQVKPTIDELKANDAYIDTVIASVQRILSLF